MISNRELKGQIEQITEQQQSLTDELQQIKELLQSQSDDSSGQGGQQSSGGQSQQQQNSGSSNSGSNSISDIAKDFAKLKDLTSQLETKMQEYISNNTKSQPLSDEDAINLVLSMMNGMIDWSMDLMSRQAGSNSQSGQLQ
ncbi:hypothetical protein GCM10023310_65370 [Paenibacillus vulneris]|uniref:Uncharacterized protein n=1 Tax=Paenibacillus vulneris TaxID=1133364 RepID=A0ABW3UGJ0_9BACL|nr:MULTISPECIES: hypothetical protein [unclassified Paenibacillus]MBE1441837.1 putative phage infection (PIP) family protein YhgE [Paenibacillus sp. OAS669]